MLSRIFILLLLVMTSAVKADTYDFAYVAQGDPRLTPIQVFDNGKQTWLQLSQLRPLPVILAITSAGEVMLPSRQEGQMLIIDRVEQQLAIVVGRTRATVRYVGNNKRPTEAVLFGSTSPIKESGMAPAPVPADQILAARKKQSTDAVESPPSAPAPNAASAQPVTTEQGKDSQASTATVPSRDEKPKEATTPTTWTLREGYMIGRELKEWGDIAGWHVEWSLKKDWSIPTKTTFNGDFKTAASEVIKTLASNGVIIRAQFFDGNQTMMITGAGVVEQ